VLATDTEIALVALEGLTSPERSVSMPEAPIAVGISHSARFFCAETFDRLSIWDCSRDRPSFELEPKARRRLPSAFVRFDNRELLVCARRPSVLEGYEPDSGRVVFSCSCESFAFSSLSAFGGGARLAALGSYDGETKDSLAMVSISSLISSPEAVFHQFRTKTGIADYGYRLLVGPCGEGAFVAFRDPEEDEDADSPDESVAYADVWAVRGFYVRQLSGGLVETVPGEGPVATGDPIAASTKKIAVALEDEIELVPREGDALSDAHTRIGRRWLAASPSGSEILVQATDGGLELLRW
jgi:hypothetical protein